MLWNHRGPGQGKPWPGIGWQTQEELMVREDESLGPTSGGVVLFSCDLESFPAIALV